MQNFFFNIFLTLFCCLIFIEAKFHSINIDSSNSTQIFENYLKVAKRKYTNKTEKALRHKIFSDNLRFIRKHNKAKRESFQLGLNHFSDMTEVEFKRVLGFKGKVGGGKAVVRYPRPLDDGKTIDLRQTGCIGDVQNQGQCGSCYAFATVEHIDTIYCLKCNKSVQYASPQNIIDCSKNQGNYGCNGGWMENVVSYIKMSPGINTLSDYPYTETEGTCSFNSQTAIYRNVTKHNTVEPDENEMMRIVNSLKTPLYVAVKVDRYFQMYQGGVFGNFAGCKTMPWQLNHAVQVVGYGKDEKTRKLYWLVKNTWSSDWGEDGYIRVWRTGCCLGICQSAGYASLECDQT